MVETRLNKSLLLSICTLMLSLQDVTAYRGKEEGGLITQCEYPGTKGIYISREKYSYQNATTTCQKLGGSLVDLSNQNILLASDILLTCVGPNSKAWIGSWDYRDDNFDEAEGVHDCLSLVVSNIGPSGTVSKICKGNRQVLCQNHDSPVEHNPFYSQPAWSSKSNYPKPTLEPGYADIEEDEDDFEYPVFYPKAGAGVYPPPVHLDSFEPHAAPLSPVFYPKPDTEVYGSGPYIPKKKGTLYPKPGREGSHKPHWRQNKYPKIIEPADEEEDCETWTLDGVATTITKAPTKTTSAKRKSTKAPETIEAINETPEPVAETPDVVPESPEGMNNVFFTATQPAEMFSYTFGPTTVNAGGSNEATDVSVPVENVPLEEEPVEGVPIDEVRGTL